MNVLSAGYVTRPAATGRLIDPLPLTTFANVELSTSRRAQIEPSPRVNPAHESPPRDSRPRETAPRAASTAPARNLEADIDLVLRSNLFDVDWYRRGTGLETTEPRMLARHYLTSAEAERSAPNPLFDPAFYTRELRQPLFGADPFVHYLAEGWYRGFDPHPLFDVSFYLERNSDVRAAVVEPLFHYTTFGWREGRLPCPEFDVGYYVENNRDVRELENEPLRHYLEYGAAEGRDPSAVFETRWYAHHVLKGEAVNPLVHFRLAGANADVLTRSVALDARYAMSETDFARWTRAFRVTRGVSRPSMREIVRVHASAADERGESSLGAARTLSRAASAVPSGARHAYLICDPADEIDEALLPRLAQRMERAELVVFDFAFRRDGAWTPVLLAGANPVRIEAVDATFSRFAIAGRLLARLDIDAGAAPWDVLKAAVARLRAEARLDLFVHLPAPLLRVADLSEALRRKRHDLAREAQLGTPRGPGRETGSGQREAMTRGPSVSVVICTKDRCRLLAQLLDRLLAFSADLVAEIVIVTNAAADSFAAEVHAHYAEQGRIALLRHDGPYNFSQQSNRGAARCTGDLLLFLNDDIVPIVPHWLEALCAPFARPEVGISGPLLLYPDESIQHAGMYLGFNGIAGHTQRGARLPDGDYMLDASAPRNVSVLTGAALLTRRALFESLNGFDRQLGTYLQDVDYCLRVRNCDREIVYEPRALLFHMESVSMREKAGEPVFGERRALEHAHFGRRWTDALGADPYHNPNFDPQDESLRTLARCPHHLI